MAVHSTIEESLQAVEAAIAGLCDTSEKLLSQVASRGHQAIIRFYFGYPRRKTTVPAYIEARADYPEVASCSEGKPTSFADWSKFGAQAVTLEFYEKMAGHYDNDPRLAFIGDRVRPRQAPGSDLVK